MHLHQPGSAGVATKPPFEIVIDTQAGIIRAVLRGLWTMDNVAAFGGGMYAAVMEIAPLHPIFGLLSDSTAFPVQTLEVASEFARLAEEGNRGRSGPTAIVVSSTLNKLQVRRMFPDPRVHVFTDVAEAGAWLDGELRAARAG
jgi:hypothetical protein